MRVKRMVKARNPFLITFCWLNLLGQLSVMHFTVMLIQAPGYDIMSTQTTLRVSILLKDRFAASSRAS